MKKSFYIIIALICICQNISAQKSTALTSSQRGSMILMEKKMKRIGLQFLSDTIQENRVKGARDFVKLLIEALKVENSFQYPFDSIPYLAKVVPEDSSFKIFTFQIMLDNYTFVHYGCIQLNRSTIKLIPFKDYSDTFPIAPQYTISNKNWYGAVYYKSVTKKIGAKSVYFLFGYDQNDLLTDKKIIEALWIEKDSIARFGMPVFEKTTTETVSAGNKFMKVSTDRPIPPKKIVKTYYRYVLEYRKKASVNLKYEKDKDLITHDHIASLDDKVQDVAFMKVPDGTYEGLKWDKVKWVWQEYVKLAEVESNKDIRPMPLKDKKFPSQLNQK